MPTDSQATKILLPCPFCGAEPNYREVAEGEDFGGEYIECSNPQCGCSTCLMFPAMEGVKDDLRDKWNRREDTPEKASSLHEVDVPLAVLERRVNAARDKCSHAYWMNRTWLIAERLMDEYADAKRAYGAAKERHIVGTKTPREPRTESPTPNNQP